MKQREKKKKITRDTMSDILKKDVSAEFGEVVEDISEEELEEILEDADNVGDVVSSLIDENDTAFDDTYKQYLRDIANFPVLSANEQMSMFEEYAKTKDKDIKDVLVVHNTRLVISAVNKFGAKYQDKSDLIQEGNIGLMRAVELFDPSKGYKFSTYALYWIRQKIQSYAKLNHTLRVPIDAQKTIKDLNLIKDKMLSENPARTITDEDLAQEYGHNISPARVHELMAVDMTVLSLSVELETDDDGNAASLINTIVGDPEQEPQRVVERGSIRDELELIMGCLEPHEYFVICAAYGLDGRRQLKLEEIARVLQTKSRKPASVQYVSSILTTALKKMQHCAYTAKLKDEHQRFGDL